MKSNNNILERDIRQRIYDFISKNQGLYLQEIITRMNIPKSTLRHHLNFLIKQDLIGTRKFYGYKRYYVCDKIGYQEKQLLDLMRSEVPRRIILWLILNEHTSQRELSKELEVHQTTIEFHLRKFLELDLIELSVYEKGIIHSLLNHVRIKKRNGNEKFYKFKNRELYRTIFNLLIKYKDSFEDKKVINDFYKAFNNGLKNTPKPLLYVNCFDEAIDEVIEQLFDVCPHPYHV